VKVLVTGGSGFLGTSVVRGLVAAGHDVASTDLHPPAVVMDVTSSSSVSSVISAERPEVVVHLASIVTPGPGSTRDLEYAVDVTGTRHVLDACVAAGVRRVVVSSSGAAYGYHADNPAWITEDQPVRGNEEFAYSHHKRLVEEMLPSYPSLEQVVLRIGTILGRSVDNQITALFERKRLLRIRGSESPFVFIWDEDVVAIIQQAVTGSVTGVFNVAGDGALTITEIAALLEKPVLTMPEPVLRGALAVLSRLGLSPYGPEQTRFLQYRPVLSNTRLKEVFGYTPSRTSREAFDEWRLARRSY
jgi:UDP-glucose 4-epimerase